MKLATYSLSNNRYATKQICNVAASKVFDITKKITAFVAILLLTAPILIFSHSLAAQPLVREGIKVCSGAFFVRDIDGVDELHDTLYVLRNFNDAESITIDRIRAWDKTGTLIWDSDIDGLPAGTQPVLNPHEGMKFRAAALTMNVVEPTPGQFELMQIQIDYSLEARGISLGSAMVRFARVGGIGGFESFRFNAPCWDK